jgi:uncharacterized membrane protein HdeD (DUF308 family)
MSNPGPPSDAGPTRGRHPALTVLMVVVGAILLLPGICAIVFMAGMGASADPTLALLWIVCLLIALGGVLLLVRAFR